MDALSLLTPSSAEWFSEQIGTPTPAQIDGWAEIAAGRHTLIAAPTGTGKTLASFLIFIDRYKALAELGEGLRLIYVSPLKALGNDIRENLRRPLDGIGGTELTVAIRTGDTTQSERRRMIKHPPHILITTPESLYLLLGSASGRAMLGTAEAVILDELHAVINSKRGAHLMLSLARLDRLCGRELQRVGLSATIEPLETAAEYLAPNRNAAIVAPEMDKARDIEVLSPLPDMRALPGGSIWPEIAKEVYALCETAHTVIAFTDARSYAEKLAYHVNELGGADYSRTHHGCVSKEQRLEAERQLRNGELRLLCATSSMELGIDVGDVDLVLQVGCPRAISSTMQRLGRAGHAPGRESVMRIFPRTITESVYCGLTASVALSGGIEQSRPPRQTLDVLAQHLVAMASVETYTESEAMELLERTYSFRDVNLEQLRSVLCMLAGDYEHRLDRPARPRLIYDRIHGTIEGDSYSRMLALNSGGTIPDRGFYGVKLPDGTKLGELDEEFVFEARVGDKFMLGAFAWRIAELRRDDVIVSQANVEGAQSPFWKGDWSGREYKTGRSFGERMRNLTEAHYAGRLHNELRRMKLDDAAAHNACGLIERQIDATGILPDDRTIIVEHFADEHGENQMAVHSVFGRRVNAPLSLLVQLAARRETGMDWAAFDDDDGFLLYPYGATRTLPEGLLRSIEPDSAEPELLRMLPGTQLFNMAYRYNAARALMMGLSRGKRQPLWVQRMRSAESLESALRQPGHPIVEETRRECLEDYWDLPALLEVLEGIRDGSIAIREQRSVSPSPLSLPLRRQAEAELLYDYFPTPAAVTGAVVYTEPEESELIAPAPDLLDKLGERRREPQNENELHSLLMAEGDVISGEVDAPVLWFENLARAGRVNYIEPGLWIAAEHAEAYAAALEAEDFEAQSDIARRCLRYRGAQSVPSLSERYFLPTERCRTLLESLAARNSAVCAGEPGEELYFHAELYSRARRETVAERRREIETAPPESYAAMLARSVRRLGEPLENCERALESLLGESFPAAMWEDVILPARVPGYRPAVLDELLSGGEFLWRTEPGKTPVISFARYQDIDWDAEYSAYALSETGDTLTPDEENIIAALAKRGASFLQSLTGLFPGGDPLTVMRSLAERGFVRSDSFAPVRQWLRETPKNSGSARQRALSRSQTLTAGRWELTRPMHDADIERRLAQAFDRTPVLARETAGGLGWAQALEVLRGWEYTGRVRRGYFVRGLSGAQFVRSEDFERVLRELRHPGDEILWLNSTDPAQSWGRVLAHVEGRSFTCVSGTLAALRGGVPVAVLERSGAVLRVFETAHGAEIVSSLARDFLQKRVFPQRSRIVVKEYQPELHEPLLSAGFKPQMLDLVLYR